MRAAARRGRAPLLDAAGAAAHIGLDLQPRAAAEAGLIVLVAGPDVVRIAPSLVISLDEILEGLARLETALGKALT